MVEGGRIDNFIRCKIVSTIKFSYLFKIKEIIDINDLFVYRINITGIDKDVPDE